MSKVLIIEDDEILNAGLCFHLQRKNIEAEPAYTLAEADSYLKSQEPDLILLDVNLPDGSGFDFARKVLAKQSAAFVFLTAHNLDDDVIQGLQLGADDYITKPFNILEVKARIKAIMRRSSKKSRRGGQAETKMITAGDLKLDREGRRVFIGEKEINLTAKEFDLLELLVCNPNKVYSRESLLSFVWGNKASESGDVRTVDVHVRRLREKIEPSPSDPKYVHTKWGVGYYFRA